MKTRPVGTELFHVDGQTDRHDEACSHIRNSADAPKSAELSFTQCSSYDPATSLHGTHRVIVLIEVPCVLCEIRTTSLYKMHLHFGFQMVKAMWQVFTPS